MLIPPLPVVVPVVVEPPVPMSPALLAAEPLVSLPPTAEPLILPAEEPVEVVSVPMPVLVFASVVLPVPPAAESL